MNTKSALYRTDQARCYDDHVQEIDCAGTGQDGDIRAAHPWPTPRFVEQETVVNDLVSGLMWTKKRYPG
jgi:hypothetical protein